MPLTVRVEVPPRDREVLASWVRSIENFIDGWNDRCHPFTWTKTADEILPHCRPVGIQQESAA